MSPSSSRALHAVAALWAMAASLTVLAGCAKEVPRSVACLWLFGAEEPRFDPDGPPESTRWALERLLTRGLMDVDSTGRTVPAAAERFDVSPDGLTYTFHLRSGLRFTDGTPCRSADFRRAIQDGLGRGDHATRAWLLAAVRGVEHVRAGKPLPEIGVETPDERTLTLSLSRPDSLLVRKLGIPGVADAWTERSPGGWARRHGLGPFTVSAADSGKHLLLIRSAHDEWILPDAGPDSIAVRFNPSAARIRTILRAGRPDLVWPLPPELLNEPVLPGYRWVSRPAEPRRLLLLVMRADLPPTHRLATRHALAHALNREEILRALGPFAGDLESWLRGAERFGFPKLDGEQVRQWMERAHLGRSFHVVMAYDPGSPAGAVARIMQGEWARLAIYVELKPLRGEKFANESLHGVSHLLLVDAQSLFDDPAADLAALVMPLRGPAVGRFRTGWRTREFDPWIAPRRPGSPLPVAQAQRRLEEEMVALPIADLPWLWIERQRESSVHFNPRFGPQCRGGNPIAATHQ